MIMKKIFSTLMAVALAAFTFTSCEDVPMPYDYPGTGGGDKPTIEEQGDGTIESPFNVAAARAKCQEIGETVSTESYYVMGKISKITLNFEDVSTDKNGKDVQYGNATFDIVDEGSTNVFKCFQVYYLDGKKNTDPEIKIKEGDEVVIVGPMYNYSGNTPETAGQGKAHIYSINGVKGPETTTPEEAIEITCAKAVEICNSLEDKTESNETYTVTGYITETNGEISREQQTFWMADTKDGGKVFEGYWANIPDPTKALPVGTKLKMTGKLMRYGTTPEMKNGNVVVLEMGDGNEEGNDTPDEPQGEAKGDGTLENPFNAVAANNYAKNGGSESEFKYVKGKISNVKSIDVSKYERAQYYISEDGSTSSEQFYIYNGYYLDKKAFTSNDQIKVGDEVIVYGKIVTYNGSTIEMAADNYIVSHNSNTGNGGSEEEINPGTGDNNNDVLTVAQAIANNSGKAWVEGYIVGWIDGMTLSSGAKFDNEATAKTNLLVADSANETNVSNCIPVQLPSGDARNALNLQDNPSNYGKKVKLYGSLEKYFGAPGLKSVTKYEFVESNSAKAKRIRK